jgi:hypothetical protein
MLSWIPSFAGMTLPSQESRKYEKLMNGTSAIVFYGKKFLSLLLFSLFFAMLGLSQRV